MKKCSLKKIIINIYNILIFIKILYIHLAKAKIIMKQLNIQN